MKKKYIISLSTLLIILVSLFSLITLSHADDDEREHDDNDYHKEDRYEAPAIIAPVPEPIPEPIPELIPEPIPEPVVISAPVTPAEIIKPVYNDGLRTQNSIVPTQVTKIITTKIDNTAAIALLSDSDQDGIPDTIDKYQGIDDFAFSLIDANHNGIADDLEIIR